jgi:hypothetical protein
VIGSIGVATLRHVREPRALLFASVPMLFAVHQFTEGFVWLGLDGRINPIALEHVTFLFMLYAEALLPLLMPVAVALMEPAGARRKAIIALCSVGGLVWAWNAWGLVFYPNQVVADHHSIAYHNPLTRSLPMSGLYIIATCGALVLSTHRVVRMYGVLNVIALILVQLLREYAFASVWCFYAAIMSIIIYWQFRRQGIDIETPNGISRPQRAFLFVWLR